MQSFFKTPAKPQASQSEKEQPGEAVSAAAATSSRKPYHEIFKPPGYALLNPPSALHACFATFCALSGQQRYQVRLKCVQQLRQKPETPLRSLFQVTLSRQECAIPCLQSLLLLALSRDCLSKSVVLLLTEMTCVNRSFGPPAP